MSGVTHRVIIHKNKKKKGTQILQIYWIYKDAIDLTFRQTFFQNELQRVLYKLVLVTYPLDNSQGIYSPSNFKFIKKHKK